jgi:Ser/Thr protein kinase RdoA (MazF antagonist)
VKDKLRGDIARAEHLTEAEKTLVNNYMDGLPEGNRLCHFDFHPDNVILTDKGPITIDWMTACKGEPVADAARTFIMLKYSDILNLILLKRNSSASFREGWQPVT